MDIVVRNIVTHCDTNADGAAVKTALRPFLLKTDIVTVDFAGINNVTSSFINTAFIELIEEHGIKKFKDSVRVANATKQIADALKDRISARTAAFASAA
ncbi:STAS-like domain-containing protein [Roseibium sp.]|uniref:STAS-like domain-containing protein n=1 Tax=Roseibium sp. TaxID=1936156 RepID=UPI003B5101E0